MIYIRPIPVSHIHEYYLQKQRQNPCIGNDLLRIGYAECAMGRITREYNNLFDQPILMMPPKAE